MVVTKNLRKKTNRYRLGATFPKAKFWNGHRASWKMKKRQNRSEVTKRMTTKPTVVATESSADPPLPELFPSRRLVLDGDGSGTLAPAGEALL